MPASDSAIRVVIVVHHRDEVLPGLPPDVDGAHLVRAHDAAALAAAIPDADAVFLWNFSSGILQGAWDMRRRLRWVHVAAVGVDAVLFPALNASNVTLTNSKGVFDGPMAEYAVALMLAFAKDLPRTLELQRRKVWMHREPASLRGANLLVVGVGGVGVAVARLAAVNGMNVTGVGRRARQATDPFRQIAGVAELATLVPQADYVVLTVPLTAETRGLFSRELIGSMQRSARLINLARGAVLDEAALVEALHSERIAGAGLDVFETEPLPADHPLWAMPNVIISPHMSADVPESARWVLELFLANLNRFRRGDVLANEVDKRLGYVPSERQATGAKNDR